MQPIEEDHAEMVAALSKSGVDIIEGLDPNKAHVLHMAIGISGESGELLDAIKKWVIYGKPIDLDNVIEELGDLEYYLEGLRQGFKLHRNIILDNNIAKLQKRYPAGKFVATDAIARADKNGN